MQRSFDGLKIRRQVSGCVHTKGHLKLADLESSKVVALEVSQSGNWWSSTRHTLAHYWSMHADIYHNALMHVLEWYDINVYQHTCIGLYACIHTNMHRYIHTYLLTYIHRQAHRHTYTVEQCNTYGKLLCYIPAQTNMTFRDHFKFWLRLIESNKLHQFPQNFLLHV